MRRVPILKALKRSANRLIGIRGPAPVPTAARFRGHYDLWRMTRINKLAELMGPEWFRGKRILEVGCGHGYIGEYLANTFGAVMTLAEARSEHVAETKRRLPTFDVIQIDNDRPYSLTTAYDLIVHWGLLYHLEYWREDLLRLLPHTKVMTLETIVSDSGDPSLEVKVVEDLQAYDQAIHGTGSRPSAAMIETFLSDNGYTAVRYDDPALNAEGHSYDWMVGGVNGPLARDGMRRFWMVYKNDDAPTQWQSGPKSL